MAAAAKTFATPRRLAAAQKLGALGAKVVSRRGRLRLRGPFWIRSWFGTRDLVAPPAESFRSWWKKNRS
jgi:L-lactate dehydrogenase complex protein LldF